MYDGVSYSIESTSITYYDNNSSYHRTIVFNLEDDHKLYFYVISSNNFEIPGGNWSFSSGNIEYIEFCQSQQCSTIDGETTIQNSNFTVSGNDSEEVSTSGSMTYTLNGASKILEFNFNGPYDYIED